MVVSEHLLTLSSRIKPKILVVDDISANLIAMKTLLRNVSAEVVTAQSGNEALALALDSEIAVVLLDVNMPEMDGFEVAELLAEMDETRNVPVIFVTALTNNEDSKLKGYLSGGIDYIEKPINGDILLSKIQIFLNMWALRYAMQMEIERRIQAEKEIEHLAQNDALTGLPNRRQLHQRLDATIEFARRNNSRFALLFLDLDGFKRINDDFGHEAGDYFLKSIASVLKQHIRSYDTLARFGGDEFVIILAGFEDSLALASKLESLIDEKGYSCEWQGHQLVSGVSIGVSTYPEHGDDADALVTNADAAMYLAKKTGGNAFRFFSDELNQQIQRRLLLEQHIESALKNNEFSLVYQPIVNVNDGSLFGAEALLRWHSPKLGAISPLEFIPVAESCQLISRLGLWIVEQASKVMRQYPHLQISVNASPIQFNDDRLCNALQDLLQSGDMSSKQVAVEITESTVLANTSDVDGRLRRIRGLGLDLCIDDFGTGYSALGSLKRCPVNKLKIDRAFISEIPDDKDSRVLSQAIIAMGHALGMPTVAEGVETVEQWQFLQEHGCDFAQGYYFSKPMSPDALADYCSPTQNSGAA